jgi:hypothetical protein
LQLALELVDGRWRYLRGHEALIPKALKQQLQSGAFSAMTAPSVRSPPEELSHISFCEVLKAALPSYRPPAELASKTDSVADATGRITAIGQSRGERVQVIRQSTDGLTENPSIPGPVHGRQKCQTYAVISSYKSAIFSTRLPGLCLNSPHNQDAVIMTAMPAPA